ncbi:shikimate dehydrogenase [Thioalkalivibrio paradoxus]|uniref:Shikimate dehydrogenase (NADP(+)) n=1 Tax=Thioalkalivibrio paradoxus ARh 1 TaxID=713585 RepID=W0DR51_9GAMM|nr:shikimate dehydrogenase [Thioalkalivibrio paradoxus]AHE99473.1 shikimate 5-dehydrogenase [Thioalkalivibrio paradoxus ARh 1]
MNSDCYAVVGNPIGHSLSPRIHALFAEQTRQDLVYEARLSDPEHFARDVRAWFGNGLRGLNVTVPFKEDAFRLVDLHTQRAERAGAVNTIWAEADGRLTGDNTDGTGFLRDLTGRLGVDPARNSILILGAGGAARGLLEPLLRGRPARMVVANRTRAKAETLVAAFADLAGDAALSSSGLDDIPPGPYDLVVNATAAGLSASRPELPAGLLAPSSALAYDLVYGPGARPFLDWAREQGAEQVSDGLGMLVEQAAEAFAIWRGARPDTRPVFETLRRDIVEA